MKKKSSLYWTPTYKSWVSMNQRCNNKNNPVFPNYWWRWITICDEWKDFLQFYRDMWERPFWCSIDRIDNNWNYNPKNCKWSTRKEQQNNRSVSVKCFFRWTVYSVAEFSDICWIYKSTVRYRIWDWMSCEEIFEYAQNLLSRRINNEK